jgi:hypothetical protein
LGKVLLNLNIMGAMKNIILDMEVDFNIGEEAVDKF